MASQKAEWWANKHWSHELMKQSNNIHEKEEMRHPKLKNNFKHERTCGCAF